MNVQKGPLTLETIANYTFLMRKAGCLLLILIIISCASGNQFTSTSLSNQGMLPLSSNNAYLGTNLYLARQAENSEVLLKFFEGKGAPAAMELIDKKFSAPKLLLYYPKDKEAYAADLERHGDKEQWIVRGPFAIKRTDYSSLARLSMEGEPVMIINGRYRRPRTEREQLELKLRPPTPTPTPSPTPTPTRKAAPKKKAPVIKAAPTEKVPAIEEFKPLNTDQQAINLAKGYAERAANGDVIHTVREGETLENIAKWYTGNAGNGEDIAKANRIGAGDTLSGAQRINIPGKLLKNLKQMPPGYK